jgi:hypothetical protein
MLWKQKRLNYLLKSPLVYLNLIGLTKTEGVDINFYLINVPARIHLVVQEISNCDTRVSDGDMVNGWRWNEEACLTLLDLCA